VNEDDSEIGTLFELPGIIKFHNPLETLEVGYRLMNLSFLKPGVHAIEFWCDEEIVLHRRITVSKVPAPQ
jgi:hypothetical protein